MTKKFLSYNRQINALEETTIYASDINYSDFDINVILPKPVQGNVLGINIDGNFEYKNIPISMISQLASKSKYILGEMTLTSPYQDEVVVDHLKDIFQTRFVIIIDKDNNIIDDYQIDMLSSTKTKVKGLSKYSNVYDKLQLKIVSTVYKDVRDFMLLPYGKHEIEFPFNIEEANITIYEIFASDNQSVKQYRISFLDKNKYILDYNIGDIHGGFLAYKQHVYNGNVYYSNYDLFVIATHKFELYQVQELKSILPIYYDNNTNSVIKIAFKFGNTFVGYDYDKNTFKTFNDIQQVKQFGIHVDDLINNNIDLSRLSKYGNVFGLVLYLKNNDKSLNTKDYLNLTGFIDKYNNTKIDPVRNVLKPYVDEDKYGYIIRVTNPNDYTVNDLPYIIDLTGFDNLPNGFKVYDLHTRSYLDYYFCNKYGTYQTSPTKHIFVKIKEIPAKSTITLKLIPHEGYFPETLPNNIHEYVVDPILGAQLQSSTISKPVVGKGNLIKVINNNGYSIKFPTMELSDHRDFIVILERDKKIEHQLTIYKSYYDMQSRVGLLYGNLLVTVLNANYKERNVDNKPFYIIKFKTKARDTNECIEVITDGLHKEYCKVQDRSSIQRNVVMPAMYVKNRNRNTKISFYLTCAYTRPHLEKELEVNTYYLRYSEKIKVDITLEDEYVIPNILANDIKFSPVIESIDNGYIGYLVSPDKQTWYTIENDEFTVYDDSKQPITNSINLTVYKQTFNTDKMYIRFIGELSYFEIKPYVMLSDIPGKSPNIDDIILTYIIKGYLTLANNIELYIKQNKVTVINKSDKQKHLRLIILT